MIISALYFQQQAVKDEWSEPSDGTNNQELLCVDDVINNKQTSQARKRGRPLKAEAARKPSDLDRDFVCHVCSETCFGFQQSVAHMTEKHRVGLESSEKVRTSFTHLFEYYACFAPSCSAKHPFLLRKIRVLLLLEGPD